MQPTYDQIASKVYTPENKSLVSLFRNLEERLSNFDSCVTTEFPFKHLSTPGNFCVTASSVQDNYVAIVLGKHVDSEFPAEAIQMFFNVDPAVKLQFAKIQGVEYDGCIMCLHQEEGFFDLQKIYDRVYIDCPYSLD